ncbi:MAG: alpha/beta fold hydrolase [Ferruginibacter sp.]
MALQKLKIIRWVKIILLIYATIGIALYYLQEKFLFHPVRLSSDYQYKFDQPFKEINLPFNETDTLSMVKFFPADTLRKGVVVYYHGNMENINHYAAFAKTFTKLGYEVWMEDYPGFGKSRGVLTEEKLNSQAIEVKRMADAAYGTDSIIIYGKSLGTGIAAYVAAASNAKMLLLETPYYSIPDLFGRYALIYPTSQMSTFKIPTHTYLENVHFPVVIFHGTKDRVIPYTSAAKLKQQLKPGDKFITIAGAGHADLNASESYYRSIDSLLRN